MPADLLQQPEEVALLLLVLRQRHAAVELARWLVTAAVQQPFRWQQRSLEAGR
jgi:hypothetical protein